MKMKAFTKRILTVALSLIMVLGLLPMTAFADGTYTFPSNSQSGNNNSTLRYYLTDENAGDINITQESGYVQLDLVLDDGWYFDKWETYFNGYEDRPVLSDPEVEGSNPVCDEGIYTFFNKNGQRSPFVNASGSRNVWINIAKGTGFYGDHSVTAVLKPIVTVNAGEGVNYQVGTNNPSYTNLAENQVAVEYGDNATITYTIDNKYIVTDVSANYGTTYSNNGTVITVSSIVKPATIDIKSRLKQQNVSFDANGGEGTMTMQLFNHSVAQALAENVFERTGYTFAGWNTKADGTGAAYADKQSATFTPVNDGDSITLYAQWTQCADHKWEDGVCTKCGAVCSHSGGMATCTEQATCEICREKYGELAKHNVVYDDSNNRIVETCTSGCNHIATATIERDTTVNTVYTGSAIEALKVSYSDNWQSGDLAITYSNNINAGVASGSITIGGATASETFTITAATMTGVSAQGYSGVYDGQEYSITVNAPEGATVTYKIGDGDYSVNNPAFKNVGTYTVSYKVTLANHSDYEGFAQVRIDKAPLTVTANKKTIIYGDAPANGGVTYTGFVANENADVLGGTLRYDYSYTQYGDVGNYDILPKGLTSNNYEITFAKGTLTVQQREIGISWDNTVLTYNGTAQKPTATATGMVNGDQLVLTVDGAETNASATAYTAIVTGVSGEKAGNYKLPSNVITSFTIGKADQTAPTVGKTDETISKKDDGNITGVTAAMEYRKDGENIYTAITGSTVENLAAGKYYIRVKGDSNHNPSPDTEVKIAAGRMLTVTVPQNQVGYTLTVDTTEIEYMAGPTITLVIADGYSKTENFAVKLNGRDMQWGDFTQTGTQGCTEDLVITVEGIADITAPNAEIDIKNNKWASFWNGITFGLFFNETQDVTITATDNGSGANTIQYYLASGELSQSEVEQITNWEGYNGTFKINPDNKYVVYAKITDNAGNVLYLNSNGVVLDKTVPVLAGISNGEVYYGDKRFKAMDDYLASLKVDGIDVTAEMSGDDEYRIVADNAEHTITVTDMAGNTIEYKITVYKNYTVTYRVDGNIISTDTVGHGRDVTLPAVPAKDGYTGKWDHDGKNITSNVIINAVYTVNSASAPSDPQSPQTGDNSNIWLWFVLLFVSSGAIITLSVIERKRRSSAK